MANALKHILKMPKCNLKNVKNHCFNTELSGKGKGTGRPAAAHALPSPPLFGVARHSQSGFDRAGTVETDFCGSVGTVSVEVVRCRFVPCDPFSRARRGIGRVQRPQISEV